MIDGQTIKETSLYHSITLSLYHFITLSLITIHAFLTIILYLL